MAGNQSVVEVAADTTGYVAAMVRAQKSAADFVTSQDRVRQYTINAVTALDASRKSLAAQGDAAVDAFNKSARQAEKFLTSIQKQADQAGKTQAELLRLRAAELGVGGAAQQYIDAIEKANAASGHMASGAGGARRELVVLGHEMLSGNWSRFGGSLMVLGEQFDILGKLMSPVGIGIAAVAAAGYVAYEAIHKLSEEHKALNAALVLTNNYADLSQGALLAYSQTISKDLGVSTGTASDALLAMAKSGMVAGADLQDVSEGIVAYSKISGESVKDVSKMFEESYGNAATAAKKWADTHHDLTQAQLDNIKVMEQSGDKAGAWREFVTDASASARKALLADNDAMKTSYESLGDAWSRFWRTAAGNNDELTKITDRISQLRSMEMDPDTNPGGTQTAGWDAEIRQLEARRDELLKNKQGTDDNTKALDTFNSMNQKHIEDMKTSWTWQQKLNDANETARRKTEALTEAAKAAGKLTPAYQAQLQSDLGATLAHNATEFHPPKTGSGYHEPRGVSLLDEAKAQQAVLEQSLGVNGQLTGWAAKRAALEEQIARYATTTLTKQQASVLANSQALLAQYKTNESLQADAAFIENVNKLTAERDQLNARLQDQNDAMAQAQQIELQTATLTTEERKRQLSMLQIEIDRRKALADWDKDALSKNLVGSDTDVAERRTINQTFDARATNQQNTFAAQDALKGNWAAGATTGLKQIIEQTSNLNQMAQSFATDGIRSIGDAFADLATTGKLNMGDMAKSLVADFVRIETEALAAKAAMSFLNWSGLGGDAAATGASSFAGAFHLAGGGAVSGPGSSTSDSIPAMLSDGEYVLNAAAVSRIGVNHLDDLNSGAARAVNSVAHYATGGAVGSALAAIEPGSGSGGAQFNITIQGGSSDYSPQDLAQLQRVLQGWVDSRADARVTKRMSGQGGYAWKIKNGSV
ncbi:phage tail length tape measure family protein [Paraburkholderia sp. USG1]|uniref:phage tail length tape measure family protein n=1 Tax=Paraburkholderia sp. USG1 TaxID=2952268 RepID=UPI00285E68C3|nr:phage tail length tape measure family protein [Paraburkholderia sp. USG1]MDR8396996.1 phage tail length tape measure family protein [Paraburkholderia sp. USG1]